MVVGMISRVSENDGTKMKISLGTNKYRMVQPKPFKPNLCAWGGTRPWSLPTNFNLRKKNPTVFS